MFWHTPIPHTVRSRSSSTSPSQSLSKPSHTSGRGVPATLEDQMFEPFFSTKERGTGLGLYLVREIVMAHEGRVALRSIKPQGAEATILLPRLREEGKA